MVLFSFRHSVIAEILQKTYEYVRNRRTSRKIIIPMVACLLSSTAHAALNIPITVNLSESVNVTGVPQIAVNVGGTTRYATYTSGTGTSTLTFTLAPQAGDVDLDGVTVSSPIQLNGGTIKDLKGNDVSSLTFTPPNTANVKVNYPSLGMDFVYDADGRYTLNGTAYNDLTSFLTAAGGSFSRASVGTYFDSTGTLQTSSTDTPRFDYTPVTHAAKGLLIEESRTNQQIYSGQIDLWGRHSLTVVANSATAPDGTNSAEFFSCTGASAPYVMSTGSVSFSAGDTITRSIFAKSGTSSRVIFETLDGTGNWGYTTFNIGTQTVTPATGVTASIMDVGNGWYRLIATRTFTNGTPTGQIRAVFLETGATCTSDKNIYFWGSQIEIGSFPTSYIPTTTAAVTRAADDLVLPTGSWFNNSSGTLFGEATAYNSVATASVGSSPTVASINTSTASNIARIGRYISSPSTGLFQSNVASLTFNNLGLWPNNSLQKIAGSYSNTGFSSLLGTNPVNTSGAAPLTGTPTEIRIGQYTLNGYWSSTISKIRYYPARVADAQLQLMTQ